VPKPEDLILTSPPEGTLYRAGRWADLYVFPPPALPLTFSPAPLLDGHRWEDAYGRFSTIKFSASAESAVGRTIARYRLREVEGQGIIDRIKGYLIADPDNADEPELIDNVVPDSYFDDAHRLEVPNLESVRFVDLEAEATQAIVAEVVATELSLFGYDRQEPITQARDRRVTRIVMTRLRAFCQETNIAGIRYAAPDSRWDAFVQWSPSSEVDLEARAAEPILPTDPDFIAAAKRLGLHLHLP